MKLFKLLCVLALVFAVSTIAYAETQSVKVTIDGKEIAVPRDTTILKAAKELTHSQPLL